MLSAFTYLVPVSLFRQWMLRAQRDIDDGGGTRPASIPFAGLVTDEERHALRLARLHDEMQQRRAYRRRLHRLG